MGDGIPEDCFVTDWEANHTAILEITERVVAELQGKLVRVDQLRTLFM